MQYKRRIITAICFMLTLNFFYDGMYYFVNHSLYQFWFSNLPYLDKLHKPLSILIPVLEIGVSLTLLTGKWRKGSLIGIIIGLVIYLLYLMITLTFNTRLYLPLHAFWGHTVWLYKMLYAVALAWLCLTALWFMAAAKKDLRENDRASKSLRNKPVSVH